MTDYTPTNNPYIPGDPYSYDLKWIVSELKTAISLYQPLSDDFAALYNYVHDYFDNLDLSQEVQDIINQMEADGYFTTLVNQIVLDSGDIETSVTDWLTAHVDPVGSAVIVDNTLTLSGAAADALVTGDYIRDLNFALDIGSNPLNSLVTGHFIRDSGTIGTNPNFAYTNPIQISRGTTIVFEASGSPGNVAALSKTDAGGTTFTPVYLFQTAGIERCVYTTYEDCYIAACFDTRNPASFKTINIPDKSPINTDGKRLKLICGVIRNTGTGWEFINDSDHEPINIDSVSVNAGGNIVIDYGFTASKVNSLIVAPDEIFAERYRIGASVGLDKAICVIYALDKTIGGSVRYRSGAWNLAYSNFSSATWDSVNNALYLYHDSMSDYPSTKRFNIALTKNAAYDVEFFDIGNDYIAVRFYDHGVLVTTPSSSCDFIATRYFPSYQVDANNLVSANGNFWIIGYVEE